jgi:hypothetical protein
VPSWQAKYSAREVAAYKAALDVWERYERDSEPFWARGQATPAAEDVFRRYWVPWQVMSDLLTRYDASRIRIIGLGTVLSSVPSRIELDANGGGSLTIRQCVDFSSQRVLQAGRRPPGGVDKPQLRKVELGGYARASSVRWMILTESNPKGERPCER